MPGENFSRRVARAASVGGGRSYRRQTPLGWYALLMAICLLGIALVGYSRYEASHPAAAKVTPSTPPTAKNLWEVGLELDICGKMQKLPASTLPGPFVTDGQGVVAIEPSRATVPATAEGKHAVLNAFLVAAGVSYTNNNLTITPPAPTPTTTVPTTTAPSSSSTSAPSSSTTTSPSSTTTTTLPKAKSYTNGQSCQGGKGVLRTKVWASPTSTKGRVYTKNAASIRFKNGQLITIAFLPRGANIPRPGSAALVAKFLSVDPGGIVPAANSGTGSSVPTTAPGATTPLPTTPSSTSPASNTTSPSKGATSSTG